jgi:hypothetical protein
VELVIPRQITVNTERVQDMPGDKVAVWVAELEGVQGVELLHAKADPEAPHEQRGLRLTTVCLYLGQSRKGDHGGCGWYATASGF